MAATPSGWINPCGGTRWRTLPDGRIEVEGRGVPVAKPGTKKYRLTEATWKNWEREFRAAGREFKIPPAMLAAIAYVETGAWADRPQTQATIESADGFHSIGIMQPIPSTARMYGFTPESRYDPLQNIRLGAKIARSNADKYGLDFPSIAASHNAGSRKCQNCPVSRCARGPNHWNIHTYSDYLGVAIPSYNALIQYMGAGESAWPEWLPYAVTGAAVGVAATAGAVLLLK